MLYALSYFGSALACSPLVCLYACTVVERGVLTVSVCQDTQVDEAQVDEEACRLGRAEHNIADKIKGTQTPTRGCQPGNCIVS